MSSCRLLRANGVETPFSGPKDRSLCYNGRLMDAYHLDLNHMYHSHASKQNQRLITFNVLCVAHDNIGKRIQSIDDEMSRFIHKMSRVENTLTVLFADHGNTYTDFATTIDGRYEQYHPSLFMVVPGGVQQKLGPTIMRSLRENQFNLMTVMDLHHALSTLPKLSTNKVSTSPDQLTTGTGIFGKISSQRSCDDLLLVMPNFCICQGWLKSLQNDSSTVHFVDFAVGHLNEMIRKSQRRKTSPTDTQHNSSANEAENVKCKPLVPVSFSFVTERIIMEIQKKITAFDFEVQSGHGIVEAGVTELFHVEIESNFDTKSMAMRLSTFDRVSPYGPYRVCADRRTDIKLCICDKDTSTTSATMLSSPKDRQRGEKTSIASIHANRKQNKEKMQLYKKRDFKYDTHPLTPLQQKLGVSTSNKTFSKCAIVKQISYPESVATNQRKPKVKKTHEKQSFYSIAYEVTNICSAYYEVTLSTVDKLKKLRTTEKLPIKKQLSPYTSCYVGSIVRAVKKRPVTEPLMKVKLKKVK